MPNILSVSSYFLPNGVVGWNDNGPWCVFHLKLQFEDFPIIKLFLEISLLWFLLPFALHHLSSTSFSIGAKVAGTYMASAGSHAIRNQYVYKSYWIFNW